MFFHDLTGENYRKMWTFHKVVIAWNVVRQLNRVMWKFTSSFRGKKKLLY